MAAFHISREPALPNFRDGLSWRRNTCLPRFSACIRTKIAWFSWISHTRELSTLKIRYLYRIFKKKPQLQVQGHLAGIKRESARKRTPCSSIFSPKKLLTFRLTFPWYRSIPEVAVDQKIETSPLLCFLCIQFPYKFPSAISTTYGSNKFSFSWECRKAINTRIIMEMYGFEWEWIWLWHRVY